MIIEKDVSQLSVGSYIIDIVEQSGNIKIRNPGWLRDFKAIETLIHQGVRRVRVDTSKKLEEERSEAAPSSSVNSADIAPSTPEPKTKPESGISPSFSARLIKAKSVFDEAKNIQSSILEDIEKNRPINIEGAKDFVDQSLEMIFDNPDALTCILNIRIKDEYLLEHSVSVSILMSVFSLYLGLDKGLVRQLSVGAFLHDVGKIKVDDAILNKPGRLTDKEFEAIKQHAVFSKQIVDETEGLSEITKQVVANHHEKLNGLGYPRGLGESSLSKYDRMISICDIFDALSADRVYKEGMPLAKAFSVLRELAATEHLDKTLVDQFIHCLGVYPVGSLVQLRSKRLAIIEERNDNSPTKPLVTAFFNLSSNAFTEIKKVDLAKNPNESIERAVRAKDFGLDMGKVSEFLMMQG